MTDDRIAAALDEIRDGDLCEVAVKIPRLVAAIEGVLGLASTWDAIAGQVPLIDRKDAAHAVRVFIATELLGKEET